ncbi:MULTISPECIES: thiopeptide-type bacteriocin biosynthesis protein [unclassified Chryseobacterium]|uniref:thiopeptide-type bacteriocin biosynthesis protein n=1 Tax=unclassified Chryseobacterium TaxID=2593645 RepID=UPI000D356E39|nr:MULTISPECIES: thiopeptide-type bacteriocin biosynthesis protein [unclassified Chryseobacterium]PTT72563.1 lantibiotic dehydratase [Chryseobacterium sp. HMWF001]PVV49965.1 lantibiotic dehydratase [Chryseobacterium sp. HMWF035]
MMKRKFAPGSEWLYLKIYTGIKTADLILEESIEPLVKYFQKENYIHKWFFIRYNDPKPHLRVRFMLTDIQNYTEVLKSINASLQNFTESGEISNIVIDTYNREIERYGENTMEDAEIFFYRNSELTLQCLPYDDEEKIIVSLFLIDQMLNKLNISVQEKLEWMKDFNDSFKREFNADKKLNSQLDKKYREFRPKYLDFLSSDEFSEERSTVLFHIEENNAALENVLRQNENQSLRISLRNFFQSIFHMNINRLFVSNQRIFEMIIYDYLVRYYKSETFYHLRQTS